MFVVKEINIAADACMSYASRSNYPDTSELFAKIGTSLSRAAVTLETLEKQRQHDMANTMNEIADLHNAIADLKSQVASLHQRLK